MIGWEQYYELEESGHYALDLPHISFNLRWDWSIHPKKREYWVSITKSSFEDTIARFYASCGTDALSEANKVIKKYLEEVLIEVNKLICQ